MRIGVLTALVLAGLYFGFGEKKRQGPFEIGFWYWHSPFAISAEGEKELKGRGLNKMFVRAGTFSTDGKNARLVIPQSYQRMPKLEIHLVFNFDSGFIRHFEEFDLRTVSRQIAERISTQVSQVEKQGHVTGVQLDFDCPTRLLPRYAQLVAGVREQMTRQVQWSATGLMSWLGTEGVQKLSKQLDFLVPQAYEGVTGRTVDQMRPVADPDYLQNVLPKAEQLACPYYIGIPAYGHGFLFDRQDRLVNVYQGIGPAEAMRHPSFKLIHAYPANRRGTKAASKRESVGEEIIKFRAIRPAPDGRGQGYTLAYSIPSPDLLAKTLSLVKEHAGPNCRGVLIYRYPEPDSTLTLSLGGVFAVLDGNPAKPNLSVNTDSSIDNFEVIEGGSPTAPTDIFLAVENIGNAATFVSTDAVTIIVEFDKPGVGDTRLRDFDKAEPGVATTSGEFQKTDPRTANAIRLTKSYLPPGKKAFVGPIRLQESDTKIRRIRWIIRDGNGFDSYQGESAPTE